MENIDTAITGLGRFDIVRCVLPPDEAERKKILDKLVLDYDISETAKKYVHDRRIAKQSDRFCYRDLNAFVRELAVMQSTNQCSEDAMGAAFEPAIRLLEPPL